MTFSIRVVDVTDLAGPEGAARAAAVHNLGEAAEEMGFLVITGAPVKAVTEKARLDALLKIFSLPLDEKKRLTNRLHIPENENCYRGFFSYIRPDELTPRWGYDMGGDEGAAGAADAIEELLMEPNAWPAEKLLPGWRRLAETHYSDMQDLGFLLIAALGRYLGVGEDYFAPFFGGGSSTLRFLLAPACPDMKVPPADDRFRCEIGGRVRRLSTPAHRDSGVMTLLWQPGGLQAQAPNGEWLSAPKIPNALNVNFGDCLEFWTGGRLKSTAHRVLAQPSDRHSIPYFFEPRFSARIEPMPGAISEAAAVRYADHLMSKIKIFGTHATEKRGRAA